MRSVSPLFLSTLLLLLPSLSLESRPLVIGICGGTAAGKTTLARLLASHIPGAAVLDQDSYYHEGGHLTAEERRLINYDEPAAIDFALLIEHVQQARLGLPVLKPWRSFLTGARDPSRFEWLSSHSCIIVEGILIFAEPRLRELFDLKIFVDLPADLRLLRRVERDQTRSGQCFSQIRDQYLQTVRPMYNQWTAPARDHADLIVRGDANWSALVPLLKNYCETSHCQPPLFQTYTKLYNR